MSREETFIRLMDLIHEFSKSLNANQNIPRICKGNESLFAAEIQLIRDIGNNLGITTTELAKLNAKSKSAISQLVDKLYQKGLVSKCKIPNSKKIELYLSKAGQAVCDEQECQVRDEYMQLLDKLDAFSTEDLDVCVRVFESVYEHSVHIQEKPVRPLIHADAVF